MCHRRKMIHREHPHVIQNSIMTCEFSYVESVPVKKRQKSVSIFVAYGKRSEKHKLQQEQQQQNALIRAF